MSNEGNGESVEQTSSGGNTRVRLPNSKRNEKDPAAKTAKPRRNRNTNPNGKPKPKLRAKAKPKQPTSEPKFLQISSLVKAFKPITINGSPTKNIITQIRDLTKEQPSYFNHYKNPERLSYLQKYFLEFVRLHPESTIYISFIIKPSDPDFPFELDELKLNLSIPFDYPQSPPKIVILNEEIPRGFAMNIEIGFNKIVKLALSQQQQNIDGEVVELVCGGTLKSQILTLDKYLESCLKLEKKGTIKFVKLKSNNNKHEPKPVVSEPTVTSTPKSTAAATATHPLIHTHIPLEVLSQRNQLVNEMVNKLPVRLFKKSIHENQYKLAIPRTVANHESIDIMISIPRNYPTKTISIKFLETDLTQYETNINTNISNYNFDSIDLLIILNKLVNNLPQFILSTDKFHHWQEMVQSVRQKT